MLPPPQCASSMPPAAKLVALDGFCGCKHPVASAKKPSCPDCGCSGAQKSRARGGVNVAEKEVRPSDVADHLCAGTAVVEVVAESDHAAGRSVVVADASTALRNGFHRLGAS